MTIYDPIYGRFVLRSELTRLLLTPEVRRLSQIRLLNTVTPSLPTLGELRRFSHTIGVLYLSEKNRSPGYSRDEQNALAAGVLLHDIGTPPFGHLFEYHLRELVGWSHEKIIRAILWGTHAPENRAHQIFAGQTIEFRNVLKSCRISFELVEAIVTEQHPLSRLLFGTIDLDNLDNVARMGWSLALKGGAALALQLSSTLCVGRDSILRLSSLEQRSAVRRWMDLRRAVYEIIVFDPSTVSAQAVLSDAIQLAFKSEQLCEDDWSLSDEGLLDRLRSHGDTKDAINREFLGRLPSLAFYIQTSQTMAELKLSDRETAKLVVEKALHEEFPDDRVLGYVFVDNGTFSKQLKFLELDRDDGWCEGSKSQSTIFYGFVRFQQRPLSHMRCKRAAERLMEMAGIERKQIVNLRSGPFLNEDDIQPTFDFSAQ